jgi:hypothetical protein
MKTLFLSLTFNTGSIVFSAFLSKFVGSLCFIPCSFDKRTYAFLNSLKCGGLGFF